MCGGIWDRIGEIVLELIGARQSERLDQTVILNVGCHDENMHGERRSLGHYVINTDQEDLGIEELDQVSTSQLRDIKSSLNKYKLLG